MKDLIKTENQDVIRISSREVAEMMNIKRHGDLISKIEGINKILTYGKIRSLDYWVESSYIDKKGESRKEYLVSKKGCEFLAHKSTGEK